jgi:hypothetical protein
VVYGVQVPGCEGRVGMAAIAEDIGKRIFFFSFFKDSVAVCHSFCIYFSFVQ